MAFFYNIGIRAYSTVIRLAAPFNEKAALWLKGRKNIRKQIAAIPRGSKRLIWFHAASLGEFEQGRPVMEALKKSNRIHKYYLPFSPPPVMKSVKL